MTDITFVDGICGGERALVPGTGVLVVVLVTRWLGGDSMQALAADYEMPDEAVEAAIRCFVRELPGRGGMKVEARLKRQWLASRSAEDAARLR